MKEHNLSIDILVNNAGMNIRTPAFDVTEDEWDKIMNTNLKSAFFMSQKAGEMMQQQGNGGRIINISSVAGHTALRTGVVYASTKAAMIQMTKVLAFEWGQHNIGVNSIGPWYFETPHAKNTAGPTSSGSCPILFNGVTAKISATYFLSLRIFSVTFEGSKSRKRKLVRFVQGGNL